MPSSRHEREWSPEMVEGDQPGLVINTGSKQGITQPPGDTAYNVSKSGVKSLTVSCSPPVSWTMGKEP